MSRINVVQTKWQLMKSLSSPIAPQLTGLPLLSCILFILNLYKTALINSVYVQTTSEEFDNAALFLGLPSTLIRHYMNPLIENALHNPRNLKTPALCIRVDGGTF